MFTINIGTLRLIMSTLLIATTSVEGRLATRGAGEHLVHGVLGTSKGCCSWGEARNYCGDPPGDVLNWCSESKDRCEEDAACNGNEAKWLPTCEPLESKGYCIHYTPSEERDPAVERDCWCSIKSENCDDCGGEWHSDVDPSTTTAKPGTCFTCSESGEYHEDCKEGFHAPCDKDDDRYIECTDTKICFDRPCAPGTSRSAGTCPEEEQW